METLQLMPVKCGRCGALFDLQYDLEKGGDERAMFELLVKVAAARRKRMLCWSCRG